MNDRMAGWLNGNAYRAYPFEEDSTSGCADGSVAPDWLVLDARAVVVSDPSMEAVRGVVRLDSFSVSAPSNGVSLVTLSFSVAMASSGGSIEYAPAVATAFVSPGSVSHAVARAVFPSSSGTAVVSLFVGAPVSAPEVPEGTHVLEEPRPILASRCLVFPGGLGIDALYCQSPMAASGRVHLRNGNSTSLRIVGGRIELSISGTEGLGYDCPEPGECDAIRYVNGQRADTDGGFSVEAGPGMVVGSGEYNGIPAVVVSANSVVDSYAKPR